MKDIVTLKWCSKCKTQKTIDEFGKNTSSKDGISYWCKKCSCLSSKKHQSENREKYRIRASIYYYTHKEKINQKRKVYGENHKNEKKIYDKLYREKNKEKISRRVKDWQKNNPDKVKIRNKKWVKANREKVNAGHRRWLKNHPNKTGKQKIEVSRKWRAIHPEKAKAVTKKWREANPDYLRERNRKRRAIKNGLAGEHFTEKQWQELLLFYGGKCLSPGEHNGEIQRDHVVPISKGGSDAIDNIQPLCRLHNVRKGNKTIDYR